MANLAPSDLTDGGLPQAGDLIKVSRPDGEDYLDRRTTYDGGPGTRINVLGQGAANDGTTNNATAFAGIFGTAGKYYVPAGRYILTLATDFSDMVEVASDVDILLDPAAIVEITTPGVPGLLIFEKSNVRIQGGIFEFAGAYTHDTETGALLAGGTSVATYKSNLLTQLGIVEAEYNIDRTITAATISIVGGSDIELVDTIIRGKAIANQQLAGICISPNADYTAAENIRLIRPVIDDFTMGIIPERGVKNLYIENPRFGRYAEIGAAPGHAIYVSANDTCPLNEDITIIGAYDEGVFVGGQLTPTRPDRGTPSFKFRKGKGIRMLATTSKRPAGCFDVLGVQNGSFIGADIAPNSVNGADWGRLIRCNNVGVELYDWPNHSVTFQGIAVDATNHTDTAIFSFADLEDSDNINIQAIIWRGGTSVSKPAVLQNFSARTGTFDIAYYAEEVHAAADVAFSFQATCEDVKGRIICNFEPRVTIASGGVVEAAINGRPAILPLATAPTYHLPGQIARADRVTWDPLSKGSGGSYLVMRNDANDGWVAIDGQG